MKDEKESLSSKVSLLEKRNGTLQDLLSKQSQVSTFSKRKELSEDLPVSSPTGKKIKVDNDWSDHDLSPAHATHSPSSPIPVSPEKTAVKRKIKFDEKGVADKSTKSRKKSKGKIVDLENPALVETCTRVLQHLTGEKKLHRDSKGMLNIGNNLFVPKDAFERNFQESGINLEQGARNLTSLIWTKEERMRRSLEGGVNTKNPSAPRKLAATPAKVNACLGAMKAHMLAMGDSDGPGMLGSLVQCRRAIGLKFTQDAYNERRQAAE